MSEPLISRHPFGMVFSLGRLSVEGTIPELRAFAEKLLRACETPPPAVPKVQPKAPIETLEV